MPTLSIIVPVYNEAATIPIILQKIKNTELINNIDKEIIIVNDASTDKSEGIINNYISANQQQNIKFFEHQINSGKGACIHTGIEKATGDFILVQDADLEYDPNDYNNLLQPIVDNRADVVYGSRFVGGRPHRILFFWHSLGNKILTTLSNMLTNLNLTDMEIGYKLFRSDILKSIDLKEKRFGFEPEVTAKISRIPNIRIYEVGIAYYGRTYEEGKKINWKDGLRAIYALFKYNVFTDKEPAVVTEEKLVNKKNNKWAYLVFALFFIAGLILIFTAKGTADEGDSIMHYLMARFAYQNPEFFFDHWAKPIFVFLAAPFSQLGFEGIKFFNLLVSTATLILTYKSAKSLSVPNAWLAPLCTAFAPLTIIITLSGLTEPLFALWMMLGFYWLIKKRMILGFVWLSFLPFVRSEGLIILSVIFIYALFKKRGYRYIPLLAIGHIFYSIAGYFVHKDFLWVFNKMSYATLSSAYGDGYWNDFLRRMPEVMGNVLWVLLIIGIIYGGIKFIGRFFFHQKRSINDEELFLVYGCFTVYFVGHSLFWALGIFNSFGLIRVMLGVLPLAGIICVRGLNLITQPIDKALRSKALMWTGVALIALFPFSPFIHAFKWQRDFSLKADQVAQDKLGIYMKNKFPDYKNYVFYYEPAYVSVALDINYFDTSVHKRLLGAFEENNFASKSFIVWDDWFAPMAGYVDLQKVENDGRFELIETFEEKDFWNQTRTVKLFRKKE